MYSNMNKSNNRSHRIRHYTEGMLLLFMIIGLMTGCVASKQSLSKTPQKEPDANASLQTEVQPEEQSVPYSAPDPSRPSVSWQPSFTVENIQVKESKLGLPELKVGARISSREKTVSLREAIKALAQLKGFTVSWNADAIQDVLIDVDINPDDDFWTALDNMLRQLDYWYEFKNNTLIIGYGKTNTYIIALPNVASEFTAAIGGNMLGGSTNVDNLGELSMTTVKSGTQSDWAEEKTTRYINRFDVWKSIRQNLDIILRISEGYSSKTDLEGQRAADIKGSGQSGTEGSGQSRGQGSTGAGGIISGSGVSSQGEAYKGSYESGSKTAMEARSRTAMEASRKRLRSATWRRSGDGEYTIDESLGIITVTTTATLQKSVKKYIDTLKKWLFRQVSIEAHVIEVELNEGSYMGIDWSKVLGSKKRGSTSPLLSGMINFGENGLVYKPGTEGLHLIESITLNSVDLSWLIDALKEQGTVRTISNPRLTLLNGAPGVLVVGETERYIKNVTSNTNAETGNIEYSTETADILSGFAFSVLCNIGENNELTINLTPVTSMLRDIERVTFGNIMVGLPTVKLRQMSTLARVHSGNLLILGGLIDEVTEENNTEVPLLGKLPVLKWAFKSEAKTKKRKELVVILRPRILEM
ncbi:MAG: hypothetical protein U9N19_08730 [Thermodesulfobacteriota bacterium]|nr:hypothetical protein [Thermodesulfobacteriota bacterium]